MTRNMMVAAVAIAAWIVALMMFWMWASAPLEASEHPWQCVEDGQNGVITADGSCLTAAEYAEVFSVENVTAAFDSMRGTYGDEFADAGIAQLNTLPANPLERRIGVNNDGPTVYEALFAGLVAEGRAL